MFTKAIREPLAWRVSNAFGHTLVLPCCETYARQDVRFGVLGTGTESKVKGRKTDVMSELLASLRQPLYLLDTRRNGVGGQGSWAPLEFATLIPERMASPGPYEFVHLPCLAPSVPLRNAFAGGQHASWRELRRCYNESLSKDAVNVAGAFVEAVNAIEGMAIFLCAEPDVPDFDDRLEVDTEEKKGQNSLYCHRFTLARRIAEQMKEVYTEIKVTLWHLNMADYQAQRQTGEAYVPRKSAL